MGIVIYGSYKNANECIDGLGDILTGIYIGAPFTLKKEMSGWVLKEVSHRNTQKNLQRGYGGDVRSCYLRKV